MCVYIYIYIYLYTHYNIPHNITWQSICYTLTLAYLMLFSCMHRGCILSNPCGDVRSMLSVRTFVSTNNNLTHYNNTQLN